MFLGCQVPSQKVIGTRRRRQLRTAWWWKAPGFFSANKKEGRPSGLNKNSPAKKNRKKGKQTEENTRTTFYKTLAKKQANKHPVQQIHQNYPHKEENNKQKMTWHHNPRHTHAKTPSTKTQLENPRRKQKRKSKMNTLEQPKTLKQTPKK